MSNDPLFEQFLQERRFLQNVTPATLVWYETAFKAFRSRFENCEYPTLPQLKQLVIEWRQRGVRPVSINTYLTALNAYCRWLTVNHGAPTVKLGKLKTESLVLRVLDDQEIRRLLAWKPKTYRAQRTHLATLLVLDTGIRLTEMLTLTRDALDMPSCVLRVRGKGQKERLVPCSVQLRALLYRFLQLQHRRGIQSELVFAGTRGEGWQKRNTLRSLHLLLKKVGVPRCGWHHLRHTFATHYLRHGGDVMRLSVTLGHSKVTTTQRYLHLVTKDLQETHARVGILSRFG